MNPPGKAIFLSYASQDTEAARQICDALRGIGLDVWFDQSELRGGDTWDASIRRQIKECALFVPIISANTQARVEGYFRREWNLAVSRTLDMADDQAFLVPVVIDATIDAGARVPEKFREVQWTRLASASEAAAFAERVQRLMSGVIAATPPVAQPNPGSAQAGATPSHDASASPRRDAPSIAVLPFVNMSRDEDNEYFADGLAEELLNVLAKISGLRVAARSSAFSFKGKGATVADAGRALNVATILEGSVRKSGNRMRISVQLVKVVDGYQLWSQTYDRTLDDIFAVQDDIAQSVLTELRTTLLGEAADTGTNKAALAEVERAVKGRSTDPEAHRLFMHGRHFIERFTQEDVKRGITYLHEALALEPEYALAWAELGRAHAEEANWGWTNAVEGLVRARDAATRALALEPDLPEGLVVMGWVRMVLERDWRGAETTYRRALELAPGNAFVLHQSSNLAGNLGRFDEAIALARRAVEQDPLNSSAYFFLGTTLWTADRPKESIAALRQAHALTPMRAAARAFIALNLLALDQGDEALTEAQLEPAEWARCFALAVIHHAAGRTSEADEALQVLIDRWADDAAYQIADVYGVRRDADRAFEWLERAHEQRDAGAAWTRVDPFLRWLHADPRWSVLLRKSGMME